MTASGDMVITCSSCGGEVAPALLACPSCHSLVHAEQLKRLADEAAAASRRGDVSAELEAWRSALDLLPPETRQHAVIRDKVDALSRSVTAGPETRWKGVSAGGGALVGGALLLWKLKAVLLIALTKGKFLLLGLGKSGTLLSMLPTFAIYWAAFGWRFAAGLIASIYVHEIGHVAALHRYGIAASAPMFIPGFGAVVRSHHHPANPSEDARVGLAGPIWGLGAAFAALGLFAATGILVFGAVARIGAWINLFNLLPVWQLDGARGLRPLRAGQRWAVVAVVACAFAMWREGLLVLIALAAGFEAFRSRAENEGDWGAFAWYAALIAVLSWMCTMPIAQGDLN